MVWDIEPLARLSVTHPSIFNAIESAPVKHDSPLSAQSEALNILVIENDADKDDYQNK
jgi:hypothetical protein